MRPFLDSKSTKFNPSFSPDGKWSRTDRTTPPLRDLRDVVSESGWQVSDFHRWRAGAAVAGDGRELFY
jgi:hypothetical protein